MIATDLGIAGMLLILGAAWKNGTCAICSLGEDDDAAFAMRIQQEAYYFYYYDLAWLTSCEQMSSAAEWFETTRDDLCLELPMCARTCAVCDTCSVEELHNCPEEKCTADLHAGAFELSFSE